jgi:hypothetical protein
MPIHFVIVKLIRSSGAIVATGVRGVILNQIQGRFRDKNSER